MLRGGSESATAGARPPCWGLLRVVSHLLSNSSPRRLNAKRGQVSHHLLACDLARGQRPKIEEHTGSEDHYVKFPATEATDSINKSVSRPRGEQEAGEETCLG